MPCANMNKSKSFMKTRLLWRLGPRHKNLHTGWSKNVYDVIQRKSVLEILKYFLMESFSICIHIYSRSQSFLSYVEKKLFQKSHPIKKETNFFVLFLFLLLDNSYSFLVLKFQFSKLKIAIEVIKLSISPQKCLFLKRLQLQN